MPNYDAGHYFLTVLAPIRLGSKLIGGQSHSRRHLLREALAKMPTAERTVASIGRQQKNPFSRNTMTHFARFAVLDDVVFNGRVSGDSLVGLARGIDPLVPQKVDRLSTPFLIFSADFDAPNGDDEALFVYLEKLWQTMHDDLVDVFQHCIGFKTVRSARDFFNYIKKCQIETTMPFNDYWSVMPDLKNLSLTYYLIAIVAAALVLLAGIVKFGFWVFAAGLIGLLAAVFLTYRKIMNTGQKPLPTSPASAPGSDLPTVLKALYMQRSFTKFAIDVQGVSDSTLHEQFGRFIEDHKPQNNAEPTQRPGVIGVECGGMKR